jgi:YfiH family protein
MFVKKNYYYEIEEFERYGIAALFTGEELGNISEFVLDGEAAKKNRQEFLKKLGISDRHLVYSRQTHSTNVVDISNNENNYFYEGVDGFISSRRDIVIFTQYADCLPVYYYDTKKNVIGGCHAGWRGSFDGIQIKLLELMGKNYGSLKEDIIVALGIGIGACCYEVQEEFYMEYQNRYPIISKEVFEIRDGKIYYDNEKFNYLLLLEAGIKSENITRSGLCTYCSGGFYSYRRQGKDAGRNGAFIYFK